MSGRKVNLEADSHSSGSLDAAYKIHFDYKSPSEIALTSGD